MSSRQARKAREAAIEALLNSEDGEKISVLIDIVNEIRDDNETMANAFQTWMSRLSEALGIKVEVGPNEELAWSVFKPEKGEMRGVISYLAERVELLEERIKERDSSPILVPH